VRTSVFQTFSGHQNVTDLLINNSDVSLHVQEQQTSGFMLVCLYLEESSLFSLACTTQALFADTYIHKQI